MISSVRQHYGRELNGLDLLCLFCKLLAFEFISKVKLRVMYKKTLHNIFLETIFLF